MKRESDASPAGGEPDRSAYEAVRRKLIERGYLDGRIERFVLDDLLHGRRSFARLARSAFKAALIGGPLLGGLLAAAAAAVNRPLVGAADLLLLWLWLGAAAGVALFVLDLGAATVVSALARHRGARSTDALRASLLVGLPTLGYLTLVWAAHRPDTGLLGDAAFLVGAVAATALVAWLAGLVSLVDLIGRTGQVPDRVRRPLLALLLATAALGVGLVATRVAAGGVAEAPDAFRPAEVPGRVWVLGIDGLDAPGVGAAAGLHERGATWRVPRATGAEPAEVWTTLLTGVPPEVHGVLSAGVERLPGVATPLRAARGPAPLRAAMGFLLPTRTAPATGVGRRVRELPEIIGLRDATAAVGWWASWPAVEPEAGGYVVSDRVLPKLLSGAAADRDTAPAGLFLRLESDFDGDRDALRREFDGVFPGSEDDPRRRLAWESFLIDGWSWKVARRLFDDDRLRAVFVYLPGLDILRSRLAGDGEELVGAYRGWLEGRMAEALDGPAETLVLVGDPGRNPRGIAEGIVVAVGPGIEPGCAGPDLGPLQVTPLLLALRGFPSSSEMPAAVPPGCRSLPDEPARIGTYGRRPALAEAAASAYDAEMLERLRSLGYLN